MGKRIEEENPHNQKLSPSGQDTTLSYSNYWVPSGQLMNIFCRNLQHMSGDLVSIDEQTSWHFGAISGSFSKSLDDTYQDIHQTPLKLEAIVRLVTFCSAVRRKLEKNFKRC